MLDFQSAFFKPPSLNDGGLVLLLYGVGRIITATIRESQQPRSKISRNLEPASQERVCLDSQKTKPYTASCGELNS